ncbi:MAG: amidase [Betaproteobacteria bacterium]|jgi:amidase|nr:amidase [Betaproteobacteria bacterium]MBK7275819.1 amidase [Betaproteobacteria bacterium]MBK8108260.1 amidase [Betaproteobacteria bacterium]MBK8863061.1 amidase [Betaproteobacteria bacterium]
MTPFAEYTRYDGLGLAALVQRGEVSPAELLEAAIARIEAHNPSLNAVVRKRYEAARAEAAQVDRRAVFAGVPFLVKDLLATLAGEPTAYGNRLLAGMPMPHSSEMVRRWRAAGLVIAGRTNTPEFGLSPYTEPLLYGPTRNPWSAAHSPGGSSGGSAAAVAAGMVPLASGGDGGGSIRIPASCCGLFGFKPSRGTTPTGPEFGELWQGFVVEHVISRSVRDSAAALDATAGADAGAPYAAPARARPFLDEVAADPGRLRVAFTSRPLFGHGAVHADVVTALQEAARLLESLGHHVEEATPPIEPEADALAFVTVLAGETRAEIEQLALLAGRKPRAVDFEPATYSLGLLGRSLSAAAFAAAAQRLQLAARRMAPFFEQVDVLLTPTLGAPPALTGALQPSRAEQRLMRVVNALDAGWLLGALGVIKPLAAKTFDYIPFTPLFNATGQPAMSMPLHWNEAGLPVGVHCVARFGADAMLFRLAAQLEQARPWFHRRPPGY